MIYTLTLNPAIDKTVYVDEIHIGGLNRLKDMKQMMGGKGINVSNVLHRYTIANVACGFVAGVNGMFLQESLHTLGICEKMIRVQGETRVNLKVIDKANICSEFNEMGPIITDKDMQECKREIEAMVHKGDVVVFAGSIPQGVAKNVYYDLITCLKDKGVITILDSDDEALRYGIQAKPNVVKPNANELCRYFKVKEDGTNKQVLQLGKQLLDEGIELVVVSMGKKGAYFISNTCVLYAHSLVVDVGSSVGAGDAMVAMLAYAIQEGIETRQMAQLAIASSCIAIRKEKQTYTLEGLQEIAKQVVLEVVESTSDERR